jgi:signal transduction histidine kinase
MLNWIKSFSCLKYSLPCWIFVLLWILPGCQSAPAPMARQGVLDLRSWPLSHHTAIPLHGEWLFTWDGQGEQAHALKVPGRWEQLERLSPLQTDYGSGTYRLRIQLANPDQGKALRLKSSFIASAFSCYANGQKIGWSGTDPNGQEQASRQNRFQVFTASPTVLLECHVSNHQFFRGGLIKPILLDLDSDLRPQELLEQKIFTLAMGAVLLIALYHLLTWSFRRSSSLNLWFGLMMLSGLIYFDMINTHLLEALTGLSDYLLLLRLTRINLYLLAVFLCFYLEALFPGETRRWISRTLIAALTGLILSSLLLPTRLHAQSIQIFWFLHLLQLAHGLFLMGRAVWHKREGAILFTLGMTLYTVCTGHAILSNMGFFSSFDYSILGYLCFGLSQSTLLIKSFNSAFQQTEQLTQQLQHLNESLEERVEKRTAALKDSNRQIQALNTSLQGMLQMVVQELKNPLSLILTQKAPTREAWEIVHLSSQHMQQLILNLLQLNLARERGLTARIRAVRVTDVLHESLTELELLLQQSNLTVKSQLPAGLTFQADPALMRRLLLNLISTMWSLKPTEIEISVGEVNTGLHLRVCATGHELPPQELERIQGTRDSLTVMDKNSCAWAVCRLIAEAHHWHLTFENLSGIGFQSCLHVPAGAYAWPDLTSA